MMPQVHYQPQSQSQICRNFVATLYFSRLELKVIYIFSTNPMEFLLGIYLLIWCHYYDLLIIPTYEWQLGMHVICLNLLHDFFELLNVVTSCIVMSNTTFGRLGGSNVLLSQDSSPACDIILLCTSKS